MSHGTIIPLNDHILNAEVVLPGPRSGVFAFFADAENLERITPPELKFEIRSPLPIDIRQGALIGYRLRLFNIPFNWQTCITHWQPDVCFVDEQIRGPYAKWVHSHRFESVARGTRVTDEVRYRLPLYPFGEIARPLVRRQLRRIFDYRMARLREILGPLPNP